MPRQCIADQGKLLVFSSGYNDQLLWLDPSTGMTSFLIQSLAEFGISFKNPSDTLQTSCYDSVNRILYFQGHSESDDSSTPTLYMLKLSAAPATPVVAIRSYTRGTMGFFCVPTAAF
jgi:hypothetical protein